MVDDNITTPICLADFEKKAREKLSKDSLHYYASGADDEQTLYENEKAFKRLRIRPRMLRGISEVDMTTEILGHKISMPICIAPTAMHKLAHPVGELGTVKAAEAFNTCMVVSTFSTASHEEIADAAPNTCLLMQLTILEDRDITVNQIRNAEQAGYKGIVLTIDQQVIGNRYIKYRRDYPPTFYAQGLENIKKSHDTGLANLMSTPSWRKTIESIISPQTIAWLISVTNLPIILKGILTAEDARQVMRIGVHGIIVSNHGARQLDGVPSTIESLPEVVKAVEGKLDVYVDGGIRKGTDVFKAIALGAKAVFIGRSILWGLAYDGENGAKSVLKILKEEFERAMILSGCANLNEILPSMVVHDSFYRKTPHHKL